MLATFSKTFAGKLAEKWIADVLTPAFAFWLGGSLAVLSEIGWARVAQWFGQYSELLQIAILLLALLVVATSAELVSRLDHAAIRLLEGYWPRWLDGLRARLVAYRADQAAAAEREFQRLEALRSREAAEAPQLESLAELDRSLRRVPVRREEMMPTQLGNRLRAAERWARDKYGLDSVVCWPRLWLLLPDGTRSEIAGARHALDIGARVWLWSLLFLVWTLWAWWAAVVGILGMLWSYRWMLDAAAVYGDLVESAFDLHRTSLYTALRWPLPADPAAERRSGEALTRYLWRGSDQPEPVFTVPSKK